MLGRLWRASVMAGLAGLALASPVAGHAQLVSSTPGAGEVVPTTPTELRLVFSEPVDPAYAGLDLLDERGATVAVDIGQPDPADPRQLAAEIPPLADGVYTVNWHALSAADGHVTEGFFTFGVGSVEVAGTVSGGAGGLHVGHTPTVAVLDAVSRSLSYLGAMLAFGLPLIGWLVVGKASAQRRLALAGSLGLVLVLLAAVGLAFVGSAGLTEASAGPLAYVVDSRTGNLLGARMGVVMVALAGAAWLTRRRAAWARTVVCVGGAASLALVALGGHAAAADSPAPLLADLIHLLAAGLWVSGLATLTGLAFGALGADGQSSLRQSVPRFSALALVSIALVAGTGLYAAWLQVGSVSGLGTDYGVVLLLKVGVAAGALVLGAINYFDAGRNLPWAGGLGRRVGVELGLAAVVLVLTANLTSGSPPAEAEAVTIPSVAGDADVALSLQPGRPGPNRAAVSLSSRGIHGGRVDLELQRLDDLGGTSRIELRQDPGGEHAFAADGLLLPATSRWSMAVVVRDDQGAELSRARFRVQMGAEGIAADSRLRVTPGLLIGAAFLLAGIVSFGFWAGGGGLPRTGSPLSRQALIVGAVIFIGLGGVLLTVALA